jgi:hypothetical protein
MALHQQTHPEYVEGCFGCKAIGTAFQYTGSQENFHNSTIRERVADMKKRAKENGLAEPVPVTRWV